jgi:hypothetical protein
MPSLPSAFKRIRLELARTKEHPAGSPLHGYEFVAPLGSDHKIDVALWKAHRDQCRVRRFWGREEEIGHLRHRPGGKAGATWSFHYDIVDSDDDPDDDEAGYRFGEHPFVPGEYVSVRDEDGDMHTFQVISVEPV